ncbi:hypothetical protein FA95DRAFT_1602014 [Auriscalpium vulgare]|uniref:Uncharacterized protein n=1 Tax=Auriscalpium vulgare TaxID=40419 RepID=A0ACB8S882_9AGAM|nr:hypothetical protein FA95DRAFT_1602014 [Auriscalpium vulgare]
MSSVNDKLSKDRVRQKSSPQVQTHAPFSPSPLSRSPTPVSRGSSTPVPVARTSPAASPTTSTAPSPVPTTPRPTPATLYALQSENAALRAQVEQLEKAAKRREREIRGLRWLVVNWGDKGAGAFSAIAEQTARAKDERDKGKLRHSGEADEDEGDDVQEAVRYLRAESESGYGSAASMLSSAVSRSSAYSSLYAADSVSDGSGSERGGAGRSRADSIDALDTIPESTSVEGGADADAERRSKDERRASRALKRLSAAASSPSSGGEDAPATAAYASNLSRGRAQSIEQVMDRDRARQEKGMDEVLEKLRAVAGVGVGGETRVRKTSLVGR